MSTRNRRRRMTTALLLGLLAVAAVAVAATRPDQGVAQQQARTGHPAAPSRPLAPPPPPAVPHGPGHLVVHILHATYMGPRPGVPSVARLLPRTEMGSPRVLPVVRRHGQWLGVVAEERPNGRIGWIHLDTNLRLARVPTAVRISLSRRTLVVRRLGRTVASAPVAVGAPGTPTPTGRFGVTDRLRDHAPSAYGCCVLALSGHQPFLEPGWSGGDRIAIHSTFETSAIGEAVSHGCIRADDRTMRRLLSVVPLGTTVSIRG